MLKRVSLTLLFLLLSSVGLFAQSGQVQSGYVQSTCSTPTYIAGRVVFLTVDLHGNLCINGGGGGGGGGGGTITGPFGQTTMANSFPVVISSNQTSFPVTIAAGTAVMGHVICDSGCSSSGSPSYGSSFPATGTPVGFLNSTGSTMAAGKVDASNYLYVNGSNVTQPISGSVALLTGSNVIGHIICDSGCSGSGGTSSNFGSSFPAAGTAIGWNLSGNMTYAAVDSSHYVMSTIGAITAPATGMTNQAGSDSVNVAAADVAAYKHVSVTSSATQIVIANTRRGVSIVQLGTVPLSCGFDSSVTTGNGDLLAGTVGAAVYYPVNTTVYCISSGSTQAVSVTEFK